MNRLDRRNVAVVCATILLTVLPLSLWGFREAEGNRESARAVQVARVAACRTIHDEPLRLSCITLVKGAK